MENADYNHPAIKCEVLENDSNLTFSREKSIFHGQFHIIIILILVLNFSPGCKSTTPGKSQETKKNMVPEQKASKSFQEELDFLNKHKIETVILQDRSRSSKLIIIPAFQGRVMTSSANGSEGYSYGWINHELISSGEHQEHINAFGGEERLWMGPEGGPFSLYFPVGSNQEFENWQVPALLDTATFNLVDQTPTSASFTKKFELQNYVGNSFSGVLNREITLLPPDNVSKTLGISNFDGTRQVAYESKNTIINKGESKWDRKTGMVSIWMLSMLNPSDKTIIFIPFDTTDPGKKGITTDYFGDIPSSWLKITNGMIYFKADGNYRGKIGLPPEIAKPWCGSYDPENNRLTLLWCQLPKGKNNYVNSQWGEQEDPFRGDVVNAYNDGPLEDGSQLGPFYELESSSPAANLKPGEQLTHVQRIYHIEGKREKLDEIISNIFGIKVTDITKQF